MQGFRAIFEDVPDPRDINAQHDLTEMLFIAMAASLCGADSCVGYTEFGRGKQPLLRQFLELKHGIPSHDTFTRVFRHLDPGALEAALARFVSVLGEALGQGALGQTVAGKVVAIDGKRLRGAYEKGRAHMSPIVVSAYLNETRMVLAQTLAPQCGEVKGFLQLLDLISLKDAIVTGDALHCTRQTVAALRAKGAHYVLGLKGNRSTLARDAAALFERDGPRAPWAETSQTRHGRTEHRIASVLPAPGLAERHAFEGLVAIGRIEAWRKQGDKAETYRARTFVLSCPLTPDQLLSTVGQHWSIENNLHWPLDVVFREDHCRTRKDHGPANLAVLRKLALNLLKTNPAKKSINMKRQRAGWDDTFLLELMTHVR